MPKKPAGPHIYARWLSQCGFGHPLWHVPSRPVRVGDVGYITDGEFKILFHVTQEPKEHPAIPNEERSQPIDEHLTSPSEQPIQSSPLDLPDGCEPFELDSRSRRLHRRSDAIMDPVLTGGNIFSAELSGGIRGGPVGAAVGVKWRKSTGAMLALRTNADYERLECKVFIKRYMRENISKWLAHANERLGLGLKKSDIVFVFGTYTTSAWAAVAFEQTSVESSADVSVSLPLVLTDGEMEFSVKVSDDYGRKVHRREGPKEIVYRWHQLKHEELMKYNNQCIFVKYYKFKGYPPFGIPKTLRAAAGPHEFPPGDRFPPPSAAKQEYLWSDEECYEEEFGLPPKAQFDPVGSLLGHISEHSDAEFFVASDSDISCLFAGQVIPDDVGAALEALAPSISEEYIDGCLVAYLSRADSSAGGTAYRARTRIGTQNMTRSMQLPDHGSVRAEPAPYTGISRGIRSGAAGLKGPLRTGLALTDTDLRIRMESAAASLIGLA